MESFIVDGGKSALDLEKDNIFSKMVNQRGKDLRPLFLFQMIKISYPPNDACNMILNIFRKPNNNMNMYKHARKVLQAMASQINVPEIVNQNISEDSIVHGLIISFMPVPVPNEFLGFVFRAAASPFIINRAELLKYIYRMSPEEISEKLLPLIVGVCEMLSKDKSPYVLIHVVKPSFVFVKEQNKIQRIMYQLVKNADTSVKVCLALNFSKIFAIDQEIAFLFLNDRDNKVVAATIPQIKQCKISRDNLKPLYSNTDPIIRVLIMRHLGGLSNDDIGQYIRDSQREVLVELIRYLGLLDKPDTRIFALLINKCQEMEDDYNQEWRMSYEIMCIPISVHHSLGNTSFEFALRCITKHPMILMKKASEVVSSFYQIGGIYRQQVSLLLEKLNSNPDQFSSIAHGIISKTIP